MNLSAEGRQRAECPAGGPTLCWELPMVVTTSPSSWAKEAMLALFQGLVKPPVVYLENG